MGGKMSKFEIIGTYRGESEVVDETDDRKDAEYLKGEYQLAFGPEWRIRIKRTGGGD
jgi:hypothetical protein